MKSLLKQTALMVSLSAGLMLVSCQNESLLPAPQQPSGNDTGARIAGIPATAPSLKLVKHGDEVLIYYPDGRLKEVQYTNSAQDYGVKSLRVEYKYGADWTDWVVATRYEGTFKKREMKWRIENGKATELQTAHYKIGSGGSPYLYTNAKFEYNAKQQLIKVISATPEKSVITFSYDGLGNVTKHLTTHGTGKSLTVSDYNAFEYSDYVGGSLDLDKNGIINTIVFGADDLHQIGDPYLPIFGKFGTKLVKVRHTSGPTFKFAHTFDAKGNVKTQKTWYSTGELLKDKAFIYR
ncbi:hypothetical protein [Dyadobacter sp. CY326]|uniref:hypothetical protein n=1 Tax=Dyadobacter sp. CY326 TaxID=2907300 RepID=UPI001F21FF7B|nr:hypothetical protein [Dyadobacter sp. CY326]MCE7067383.1 hypothetical protein [Dyadobacter sp. CY326]